MVSMEFHYQYCVGWEDYMMRVLPPQWLSNRKDLLCVGRLSQTITMALISQYVV